MTKTHWADVSNTNQETEWFLLFWVHESKPVLTVRPKIADLNFHLYGRSIHPELFNTSAQRIVERENYRLHLNITSDGHFLVFEHDSMVLSEVAAGALHPLPSKPRAIPLWIPAGHCRAKNVFLDRTTNQQQQGMRRLDSSFWIKRSYGFWGRQLYQHSGLSQTYTAQNVSYVPRFMRHRKKSVRVSFKVSRSTRLDI